VARKISLTLEFDPQFIEPVDSHYANYAITAALSQRQKFKIMGSVVRQSCRRHDVSQGTNDNQLMLFRKIILCLVEECGTPGGAVV
jgi:hypothetical protein